MPSAAEIFAGAGMRSRVLSAAGIAAADPRMSAPATAQAAHDRVVPSAFFMVFLLDFFARQKGPSL
jgi:hypothetical protein